MHAMWREIVLAVACAAVRDLDDTGMASPLPQAAPLDYLRRAHTDSAGP
jgi:hypothetical protein